tara:strand:+ start:585 stop:734 length:150 start_codon:yes stop_codon:yes gene_type:complete
MSKEVKLDLSREEAELLISVLRDIYGIPDIVAVLDTIASRLEVLVRSEP